MTDHDLVCPACGSDDLRMRDGHGWCECQDCGEVEHAIQRQDYEPSEVQQGLILIPEGYNEQ